MYWDSCCFKQALSFASGYVVGACRHYHAQLSHEERAGVQEAWSRNQLQVGGHGSRRCCPFLQNSRG
jgi:hypothetical protein